MICTLKLYLKGHYYSQKEVRLSDDQEDLTGKENLSIRETQLQSAASVFRIENYRQIIKCQYDYDIVAIFKSSMTVYDFD